MILHAKNKKQTNNYNFSRIMKVFGSVWWTKFIANCSFSGEIQASIAIVSNLIPKKKITILILSFLVCIPKLVTSKQIRSNSLVLALAVEWFR